MNKGKYTGVSNSSCNGCPLPPSNSGQQITRNDMHYTVHILRENVTITMQELFQWKQYIKSCNRVLRKIVDEQQKQHQTTKITT